VIWAFKSLVGFVPEGSDGVMHAIDPEQLGTSQEAFCETSPPVGARWLLHTGSVKKAPVCIHCHAAMRTQKKLCG
jgi:hypothetical protein